MKYRINEMFPEARFQVKGKQESVHAARYLVEDNRFQFECWALSLVHARPSGGGTDLSAFTFIRGILRYRADLSYANLTDANLTNADLRGANLRRAYLIGDNLSDANLRGLTWKGPDTQPMQDGLMASIQKKQVRFLSMTSTFPLRTQND